ncbi:MAG: D-alanine--D-alanine ligase [Acidobacteria bacterium]|nr:D-alanine--D-alanine ligase [Acidobacteriota bacterium]
MTVHVALIFGGESPEHEVSIVSARFVAAQLREAGYDVTPVGIDVLGGWHKGEDSFVSLAERVDQDFAVDLSQRAACLTDLVNGAFDVVFPLVHGVTGEDGSIQGMCELFGIPYVGGDPLCQALCYDKLSTRMILKHLGLPQPDYVPVYRDTFVGGRYWVLDQVEASLHYPVFVKPSRTGSSIGITKAHSRNELMTALETAFQYDRRVIVEQTISGREIEVALLGDFTPLISAPGEIIPENEFYDYDEKYVKNTTLFEVPASMSVEQLQQLAEYATTAWRATNCYGMARVDFMVSESGVYLNEINTVPGFTEISMYPRLLREGGLTPPELMSRLVELAIDRGKHIRRYSSRSDWYKS